MCQYLVERAPVWYVSPSSGRIQTKFLVREKEEEDKMLELIKLLWSLFGVSISFHRWMDVKHHPLINFMMSSLIVPIVLKDMDTHGRYKYA